VAGCLAEREREELLQEVPEVDQIVGVFGREEIRQVVDQALAGAKRKRAQTAAEQRSLFRPAPVRAQDDTARLRITPPHYPSLTISQSCHPLSTISSFP